MKNWTSLILMIILLIGCTPRTTAPLVSEEATRITSFLRESVTRQQIAGLTLAATRNDSLIYTGAFGFRNVDTKEPMKTNNFFHWASVSKTFVATAIMQLAEKGKLKLDDKLVTILPYFKQKGEDYKNITIRQMLNHTSGIGDVEDYEWDKPQNDDDAPERYVRSLANDKMLFSPGTGWSYSNTAFETLGVVISTVSGLPFETYIKQNIFEPLGMKQTSFVYPEIPDSLRVSGHVWAGKPIVSMVYPYNKIHAPSSTLNSNVLEMTHYAMANLYRGKYQGVQILSDSSYNTLWTNSVKLKDKPKVGAGWFLGEYKGMKTMSHSGGDTGFRSHLLLIPEKNISVMLASNYELCRTEEIAHAVVDLMLGQKPEDLKTQIGFAFSEVLLKDGVDKAKMFYNQANEDSIQHKRYLWKEDEGAFTYPGYLLMDANLFKEAIEVFKFNLELNPKSGYAVGNLGVAYARSGDKKLAKQNLTKAIQIFPREEYYRKELDKVK